MLPALRIRTNNLDAVVDAGLTHIAKAAIKRAWGVDVSVSDDESSIGF